MIWIGAAGLAHRKPEWTWWEQGELEHNHRPGLRWQLEPRIHNPQELEWRRELESLQSNGVAQLQQAKAQVEVRLAETRRHLDNMPVYTALAVTGETVGRADLVTDSLESCVAANQAFLTAPPRTGSGGSTVAGAGSGGSAVGSVVAAVDFLTPAVELKDEKSGESGPPTVSELTAALRALVQEREVDGQ